MVISLHLTLNSKINTMNRSETIIKLASALVKAQSEMGNAVKDANNPFFKSKYADLNSVREASLPILNKHGISVIQPTCVVDAINYVETILLHESGEYISSLTQIVAAKPNDAQSHGSGLSYARRYALQSICNIGAEDDDANKAVGNKPIDPTATVQAIESAKSRAELEKVWAAIDAPLRCNELVVNTFKKAAEKYPSTVKK